MGLSRCPSCGGSGKKTSIHKVYDPYSRKDKMVEHSITCSVCGGSGYIGQDDDREEDKSQRKLED